MKRSYWQPEFFGNVILVNGKTWPNLNVKKCQYRLRLLNGSNARFYELKFSNNMTFIGEPPLDHPTEVLPVYKYLEGSPIPPDPNESGWKDTIRANPGEVTTILIRYSPQDSDPTLTMPGTNLYPFNPSSGPGYVWHCHILDHEDNEMMRGFKVISNNDMMEPHMEITTVLPASDDSSSTISSSSK